MNKEASDKNEQSALISLFCEIASSSTEEAKFFLESHGWDLDASVSTFLDHTAAAAIHPLAHSVDSPSVSRSPPLTPPSSESPSRSRSASPPARSRSPYQLRKRQGKKDMEGGPSRRTHGDVRTLADLNRPLRDDGVDSDDEKTEYYTGGEKSGMIVQDPSKGNDVESIFNQARQSGAAEGPPDAFRSSSSSRSFTGTARMLSGEAISPSTGRQQPEIVTHNINFWSNGFTVDDGPLRRLDDPANLSFLESLKKSECPTELQPADRKTAVHVNLTRKEEDFKKPVKHRAAFEGVGRTLGSCHTSCSDPELTTASTLTAVPAPSVGLIVDENLPTTSIQIRLADGTRMVSRFNHSHTVNDIRSFIHASRPGCGSQNYQLQLMGFPPVQLTDPNQTIEQAGLANSVIIQKF